MVYSPARAPETEQGKGVPCGMQPRVSTSLTVQAGGAKHSIPSAHLEKDLAYDLPVVTQQCTLQPICPTSNDTVHVHLQT